MMFVNKSKRYYSKPESSHSPQVSPPRQCYSPGGVTIFNVPAVPLCPLQRYGNENFKVNQNSGFLPDHPQNWITGSLCHVRHTLKISERSVHNFLSYLANRQTNKQTKTGKNITSLAEVIIIFNAATIYQWCNVILAVKTRLWLRTCIDSKKQFMEDTVRIFLR